MADDYENLGTIRNFVSGIAKAVRPSKRDVVQAIQELIRDGHAQAYDLESQEKALPVPFAVSKADNLWYYATPAGKAKAKPVDDLLRIVAAGSESG